MVETAHHRAKRNLWRYLPASRPAVGAFLLLFVIISNTVVGALAWHNLARSLAAEEASVAATTANVAHLLGENISSSTREIDIAMQSVAQELGRQLAAGGIDASTVPALLRQTHAWVPHVYALRVTDAEGTVLWGTDYDPNTHVNLADRDHFTALRDDPNLAMFCGKVIEGRITKGWLVPLARRYSRPDGSFAGIVIAALHVDYFYRLLSRLDLGPHGVALLRGGDTGLISRYPATESPSGRVGAKGFSGELAEIIASGVESATFHSRKTADGIERTNSYRRLSVPSFHLIAGMATRDYQDRWRSEATATAVFSMAFLFCSSLLAWLLWRAIGDNLTQRARLSAILRGTDAGTWEWNVQTGAVSFDEKWAEMVGYRLLELEPISIQTWTRLCHPDDLAVSREALDRHFRGESDRYQAEVRMRHKDGHWVWVHDRGRVTSRLPDGKPLLMSGTHQDISDRKTAEEALAEREKLFHQMFESGGVIKLLIDPETGNVVEANAAAATFYGYPLEVLRGLGMSAINTVPTAELRRLMERALAADQTRFVVKHRLADGSMRDVEVYSAPVDLKGQTLLLSIIHDVSERILSEGALANAHARLEQQAGELARSNEDLEHFAYIASHDLRQPLRQVVSYLTLLERQARPKLVDDEITFLDFAVEGGKRMDRMIVSLLEYSRVGRKKIDAQQVDLGDAVADAVDNLSFLIRDTGAVVDVAAELPAICGDRVELTRLFQNLLGNSIKYCRPGVPPVVTVSVEPAGGGWIVDVSDNGVGIAVEERERAFEIFQRLSNSEHQDGVGIGLAVCRKVVEHHGGRIWIEDTPCPGCRFRIFFPTPRSTEDAS